MTIIDGGMSIRKHFLSVPVLLSVLVFCAAARAEMLQLVNEEAAAIAAQKPAKFKSYMDRMDYLQTNLPRKLDSYVRETDLTLSQATGDVIRPPTSRLRLTVYTKFSYEESAKIEFNPDYEFEVELPNLEQKWNVYVDGQRDNYLPGTDAIDQKGGSSAGVRKTIDHLHIKTEAGIDITWPPDAHVQAEWSPLWVFGHVVVRPREQIYYELSDGAGTVADIPLHLWIGPGEPRNYVQYGPGIKWSETSDGVEWEQTIKYGHVMRRIETRWDMRRIDSSSDVAHGWELSASEFGHSSGETVTDSRRVRLTYRRPLYRQWIYLELMPTIEWRREDEWNTYPSIQVGFDMLFWGGPPKVSGN